MKERFSRIHIIIEFCLAVICLGIGRFEDKFILPMFVVATVYNLAYVLFLRKKAGEKILVGIANIIMILSVLINAIIVSYSIYIFFFGYTNWTLLGSILFFFISSTTSTNLSGLCTIAITPLFFKSFLAILNSWFKFSLTSCLAIVL